MRGKNISGGLKNFLNPAVLKHPMESTHFQIVKVDIYLFLQALCKLHDFTFTLKTDFNTIFIDLNPLLNLILNLNQQSQIVVFRTAVKHILHRIKSYHSLLNKTF